VTRNTTQPTSSTTTYNIPHHNGKRPLPQTKPPFFRFSDGGSIVMPRTLIVFGDDNVTEHSKGPEKGQYLDLATTTKPRLRIHPFSTTNILFYNEYHPFQPPSPTSSTVRPSAPTYINFRFTIATKEPNMCSKPDFSSFNLLNNITNRSNDPTFLFQSVGISPIRHQEHHFPKRLAKFPDFLIIRANF
jgi:hypothetical protein